MEKLLINTLMAIIFLVAIVQRYSAQTSLNVVTDFNFHQQIPHYVLEYDGRIFTAGIALPKEGRREPFFVEYDKNLSPISYSILDDSIISNALGNISELLYYDNKLYKGFSEIGDENYGHIVEYDIDQKSAEYFHVVKDTLSVDGFINPISMIISHDGKMTALYASGLRDVRLQIFDLASNGEISQSIRISDPNFSYYPMELLSTSNGTIVLGQFDNSISEEFLGTFVWKLDNDLNIVLKKEITNTNYRNFILDAVVDNDDNIIMAYSEHDGGLRNFRPLAIKLNKDLDITWERPIGNQDFSRYPKYYTEVVESSRGDGYLFCGKDEEGDSIGNTRGQVTKLSLEGDSIWHRKFLPLNETNRSTAEINHIVKSSDGHYILCGSAGNKNSSQDSIFFLTWMLKIDEEGHLVLSDTTNAVTQHLENKISIYPNPTSDMLYIEHDDIYDISYEMFNLKGQKVFEARSTESNTTYMMDLGHLTRGLYYLHIVRSDGKREARAVSIR